jgi:hypothetical protein
MATFRAKKLEPLAKWGVVHGLEDCVVAYTTQSLEAELIASRLNETFADAVAEVKTNWVLDEIYSKIDKER